MDTQEKTKPDTTPKGVHERMGRRTTSLYIAGEGWVSTAILRTQVDKAFKAFFAKRGLPLPRVANYQIMGSPHSFLKESHFLEKGTSLGEGARRAVKRKS